jgi:hypothetical protein
MKRSLTIAGVVLASLGMAPVAKSDASNKQTTVTFSGVVGIPGMDLPPGKYVFKLVDSPSSRNIVQILNTRQNKVFATLLTIPDYRPKATSKTVITFGENCPGLPEHIKAWFYPGDNTGNRFVYPKDEAMRIAKACHVPVPHVAPAVIAAVAKVPPIRPVAPPVPRGAPPAAAPPPPPPHPAVVALTAAPVKIAKPETPEVEYAAIEFTEVDANDRGGYDSDPDGSSLPQSGSNLQFLFGLGLVCLGVSGATRFAWMKFH